MILFTTDTLPENMRLIEHGGIVTHRSNIQISKKGFLDKLFEGEKNEDQEALNAFTAFARNVVCPSGARANAVIGVGMSTSVVQQQFATLLITTYYGTAVRVEIT